MTRSRCCFSSCSRESVSRSDNLLIYRFRQSRGYRVANLLPNPLVSELKVHGKGLQTCDLPTGKQAPARGVVIGLSPVASQRFSRLARIVWRMPFVPPHVE